MGHALDSIVCSGCIVSGGEVIGSILGPCVRINSYSHVEDSILFDGVRIGRHAKVRRAIIEKGVQIPEGMSIGYDLEEDRRRGFTVTPEGVVVIPRLDNIAKCPAPLSFAAAPFDFPRKPDLLAALAVPASACSGLTRH